MKKFTIVKSMLFSAMLLGSYLATSAQNMAKYNVVLGSDPLVSDSIRAAYRSLPSFADFNNDGFLDIYYGGQGHGIPNQDWVPTSMLLKNVSGTSFDKIEGFWGQESPNGIPVNSFSNTVFFDYNNDGYLDVIIQSSKEWGIDDGGFTQLYKNTGPEGNYKFELVPEAIFRSSDQGNENKSYASIAVGDIDKDGFLDLGIMQYYSEGSDETHVAYRTVTLYRNNGGDGTFTKLEFDAQLKNPVYVGKKLQENFKGLAPMSKGSISFGDLDNDGLLDIVVNGWVDGSPEGVTPALVGGQRTKIYKNVDGLSFIEVTPSDFIGDSYDSEIKLADFNNDGYLDIFVTGEANPSGRHASLFTSSGNGDFDYEFTDYASLGLMSVAQSHLLIADLNNDGRLDIITNGFSDDNEFPDSNKKVVRIYYGKTAGDFTLDESFPLVSCNEGGMAIGDLNNDNNLDVMVNGWLRGDERPAGVGTVNTPTVVYKSDASSINENEAPSTPKNLSATYVDGKVKLTWEAATDDHTLAEALVYNIYAKNKQTGDLFMLIPADLATGRLKATSYVQTGTRMLTYEMTKTITTPADYEFGVQAIDQAFVGGTFATATLGSSSVNVDAVSDIKITIVEDAVLVQSDNNYVVTIFEVSGRAIAQGYTNAPISVPSQGVFLIAINGRIYKIVK